MREAVNAANGLPLRNADVQGLLMSAGKSIAAQAASDHVRDRLKTIGSLDEFRSFLEEADLGMAAPGKEALIEAVTGDDWEDHYTRLLQAANVEFQERMSPSS